MTTVVSKNKKSVLLEDESGYRYYVERETYENAEVGEDLLDRSIPYSVPFSYVLEKIVKEQGESIEKVFYATGLHTVEDILNNRKQANDILKRYFSGENIVKFSKEN